MARTCNSGPYLVAGATATQPVAGRDQRHHRPTESSRPARPTQVTGPGPCPLPNTEADQVWSPRSATPSALSKWPAPRSHEASQLGGTIRVLPDPRSSLSVTLSIATSRPVFDPAAWLVCWRPWVTRRGSCRGCIQRRHGYITRGADARYAAEADDRPHDGDV
jgi:hypothetical protein